MRDARCEMRISSLDNDYYLQAKFMSTSLVPILGSKEGKATQDDGRVESRINSDRATKTVPIPSASKIFFRIVVGLRPTQFDAQ